MRLEGGVLLDNSHLYLGEGGQEEKRWEGGSHLLHRSVDVRVVKLEYMLFSETNEEETYRG